MFSLESSCLHIFFIPWAVSDYLNTTIVLYPVKTRVICQFERYIKNINWGWLKISLVGINFFQICLFSRFWCLAILMVKSFSLHPVGTSLVSNYAHSLPICCQTPVRRTWFRPVNNLLVVVDAFYQLPSQPSLLTGQVLQPSHQLGDPLLNLLPSSMSFLHCRSQTWPWYSRYSLRSAELSGTVASLALLAVLLFMQPRRLLPFLAARAHCWLTFTLTFTFTPICRDPNAFSAERLPSQAAPSLCHCKGLFLLRYSPILHVSCQHIPPTCLGPSEWDLTSGMSPSSPICYLLICIFFFFFLRTAHLLIILKASIL